MQRVLGAALVLSSLSLLTQVPRLRLVMPPKSKASAAAEPVAVEDLFASLHRHIEAGAFKQAAKVADQGQALHLLPPSAVRVSCPNPRSNLIPTGSAVLKAAPGDEDAVRCKVVAYIKADEIDKALAAIRAAERLPIDLSYYRVTRFVLSCPRLPDVSFYSLVVILAYLTRDWLWLGCGSD